MSLKLDNYRSHCPQRAKVIVCIDPGTRSKYTAVNRKGHKVRQYLVDGEVIKDQSVNKCDWIITEEDLCSIYLIELKGAKIHKAILQLESTEQILASSIQKYNRTYYRISPTHVPHQLYSHEYKLFKQKHPRKGEFICKENLQENIN